MNLHKHLHLRRGFLAALLLAAAWLSIAGGPADGQTGPPHIRITNGTNMTILVPGNWTEIQSTNGTGMVSASRNDAAKGLVNIRALRVGYDAVLFMRVQTFQRPGWPPQYVRIPVAIRGFNIVP